MVPYGWEGNRRPGVALAMRHRLLSTHGLNGLRKGDEHPAYTPYKEYGTLYLLPLHPRLLMPPWLGQVPQYQIVVSPLRLYPLTT